MTTTTPHQLPPAVQPGDEQIETRREPMLTQGLTRAASVGQARSEVAQYFEGRHSAAEARAIAAEKLAASRAVELARANAQLEAIQRLTGPSVVFQTASVALGAVGGWLLSVSGFAGGLVVAAAGGCYLMGTWMQRRVVPPTK